MKDKGPPKKRVLKRKPDTTTVAEVRDLLRTIAPMMKRVADQCGAFERRLAELSLGDAVPIDRRNDVHKVAKDAVALDEALMELQRWLAVEALKDVRNSGKLIYTSC